MVRRQDRATTRYDFDLSRDGLNVGMVRIEAHLKQVLSFTVQYQTTLDDRVYPVVRYDTAHGDAHRDTLDWDGRVIDKLWLPGRNYGEVLNQAIADIRANWQSYLGDFLIRRPKP